MKRCAKCLESKDVTAFHRYARSRDGLQSYCKACAKDAVMLAYQANPRAAKIRKHEWRLRNPEKAKARDAVSNAKRDKAISRARDRLRYHTNPLRRAASIKASAISNQKRSRTFNVATRRASQLSATPAWRNVFFMREAYSLAALRTRLTGFRWEVDHIVPLRSRAVCGLHAETNLRVIPKTVNAKKHNTHWPHMPENIEWLR
jgi:hypothetical protein